MLQFTVPLALAAAYIIGGSRYLRSRVSPSPLVLVAATIMVIVHCVWIGSELSLVGARLSIAQTLSLVSLALAFCALISIRTDNNGLGYVFFIVAGLLSALTILIPESATSVATTALGWPLVAHIGFSLIAYTLLVVAAIIAATMVWRENQIRKSQTSAITTQFPPLLQMEAMLFGVIWAGFCALSLSIFSGLIFIRDLGAQHLTHKTILTLLAWIVFGGLLMGRIRFGWRGTTAVRWTLTGFALLLLAYFGSRIVLEVILHRQWG